MRASSLHNATHHDATYFMHGRGVARSPPRIMASTSGCISGLW